MPGHHLQLQHRAEGRRHADAPPDRLLFGLWRRLGALCRAARRRAWRLQGHRARRLSPVLSCSAPSGWWSTPASTTSAGPASRRSTTWSPRPASPGRASSARSSAIAPRPARPAATRSATSPGPAPGPRRRRRSATGSTSSDFHDILKEGAMPLTIFERRVDERIAAKLRG